MTAKVLTFPVTDRLIQKTNISDKYEPLRIDVCQQHESGMVSVVVEGDTPDGHVMLDAMLPAALAMRIADLLSAEIAAPDPQRDELANIIRWPRSVFRRLAKKE